MIVKVLKACKFVFCLAKVKKIHLTFTFDVKTLINLLKKLLDSAVLRCSQVFCWVADSRGLKGFLLRLEVSEDVFLAHHFKRQSHNVKNFKENDRVKILLYSYRVLIGIKTQF